MSAGDGKKAYGLILPKSKIGLNAAKPALKKNAAFDDSDSDTESGGTDWVKQKMKSTSVGATKSGGMKRQAKLEMERAIAEDPTVYQYDEVYDEMETKKKEVVAQKKDKDRKPKYIKNLLKSAEVRNRENERRIEKKVQKEREAEGDEFADKEAFVTSAYRKKMEEMQKLEEEEQRKERIEEMLDVTKQRDMSGFYRHLYRQTMGEEKEIKQEEKEESEEKEKVEEEKSDGPVKIKKLTKQRQYRQRDIKEEPESNEDESDSEESDSKEEEEENEDTEAEKEKKMEERRKELKEQKERRERRKRKIAMGESSSEEEEEEEKKEEVKDTEKKAGASLDKSAKSGDKKAKPEVKKPKVDVWKKVTVGAAFDAALKRYLDRKSNRTRFP